MSEALVLPGIVPSEIVPLDTPVTAPIDTKIPMGVTTEDIVLVEDELALQSPVDAPKEAAVKSINPSVSFAPVLESSQEPAAVPEPNSPKAKKSRRRDRRKKRKGSQTREKSSQPQDDGSVPPPPKKKASKKSAGNKKEKMVDVVSFADEAIVSVHQPPLDFVPPPLRCTVPGEGDLLETSWTFSVRDTSSKSRVWADRFFHLPNVVSTVQDYWGYYRLLPKPWMNRRSDFYMFHSEVACPPSTESFTDGGSVSVSGLPFEAAKKVWEKMALYAIGGALPSGLVKGLRFRRQDHLATICIWMENVTMGAFLAVGVRDDYLVGAVKMAAQEIDFPLEYLQFSSMLFKGDKTSSWDAMDTNSHAFGLPGSAADSSASSGTNTPRHNRRGHGGGNKGNGGSRPPRSGKARTMGNRTSSNRRRGGGGRSPSMIANVVSAPVIPIASEYAAMSTNASGRAVPAPSSLSMNLPDSPKKN